MIVSRTLDERMDERPIWLLAHSCIQIDDVQPLIFLEFVEEAENVSYFELPLAAMNELHSPAALQIDTGNQHLIRTSIP
jgi:hypothetical protein